MFYRVYSDAAVQVQKSYSSIAFLVLGGNKFIKSYSELIKDVNSSYIAESYAVGKALRYLVEELELTADDKVTMFSDSLYTLKFANKCLRMRQFGEESKVSCKRPVSADWLLDIYDYIPKVKATLSFSKVASHQGGKNPHCYVDRLAKVVLASDK